ncbi:MAG: hypothetical protein QXK06_02775 [Candidatus Diapherotrites archaeon]
MDEKTVPEQKVIKAVENLIDRASVEKGASLFSELRRIGAGSLNKDYEQKVLLLARNIAKHPWFLSVYEASPKLKEFKQLVDSKK